MPQRFSHIGLFDAKSGYGVTAPIYSLQENAHGAKIAIHSRPKCRIYSNAAGASPGQHTIPNVILLSEATNVKCNCANIAEDLRKSLLYSTKEGIRGQEKTRQPGCRGRQSKKHVIARRAKPDAPQGGLSCPSGNSLSGNPVDFQTSPVDNPAFFFYLGDRHTSLRTGSR